MIYENMKDGVRISKQGKCVIKNCSIHHNHREGIKKKRWCKLLEENNRNFENNFNDEGFSLLNLLNIEWNYGTILLIILFILIIRLLYYILEYLLT